MKVVINTCYGGFGLSNKAYEKLIEWGVPVQKYTKEERDPKTHLIIPQPANGEKVIFDRELTPKGTDDLNDLYYKYTHDRYWEIWLSSERSHPLLIRVVEELGAEANGSYAELKVVEIPDNVEYEIAEYDGQEHIAERHRTWC